MTTISTDRLYATLVAGALAAVNSGSGATLGDALGNRLYRQAAPADAAFPYAMFSLRNPQDADGNAQLKLTYQFEGFVFNRPRSSQARTEGMADTWANHLRTLRDTSNGLMYATDVTAESFPVATSPADRSVVQIRVAAKLHVWPAFLSSLSS